ncbi:MAG: response regulator, partial [Pseudomonadota bacterium]
MGSVVSVLLIDDDEEDFEITRFLLNDAPGEFHVDWAKDYRSAVESMKNEKYDVCIVDYMIGGETGIEFLQMANKESLKCPMILLTGIGQHDVDMAALKAG